MAQDMFAPTRGIWGSMFYDEEIEQEKSTQEE
jgi:hypothetical protein